VDGSDVRGATRLKSAQVADRRARLALDPHSSVSGYVLELYSHRHAGGAEHDGGLPPERVELSRKA
jgi:hypothetical protein